MIEITIDFRSTTHKILLNLAQNSYNYTDEIWKNFNRHLTNDEIEQYLKNITDIIETEMNNE